MQIIMQHLNFIIFKKIQQKKGVKMIEIMMAVCYNEKNVGGCRDGPISLGKYL